MAFKKLPNYLKTYRKRSHLTQADLAFLFVGVRSETKVNRYENLRRRPDFRTSLGYNIIFGVSFRELFAGECQEIEAGIRKHARLLAEKLRDKPASPEVKAKILFLETFLNRQP